MATYETALQVTIGWTIAIWLLNFVCNHAGVMAQAKTGGRPAEDTSLGLSDKQQSLLNSDGSNEATEEKIEYMRWKSITSNNLENIPLGLLVIWVHLISRQWGFQIACTTVW
eukprot:CAMPEP_0114989942 /NCGR_PEP_ID=MMETSP0216-20121206/10488_1 /TAXON_ID=223996 /ORGANISM="Protocruzia adherens, Strain Boccale" /LENGTH=111 /DNA_ID=CAMNT_0002352997 /DNA_START=554 /DNA_END=886 /DNA_ORIENTATION=-